MTSKPPSTLRSQLTRLVAVAVLPVWLLSCLLIFHAYTQKRDQVNEGMLERARATTILVDKELGSVQTALQAFATSPYFAVADFAGVHRQALRLLKFYPGANIVVADETGQELVNCLRSTGDPLPKRGDLKTVRSIFTAGQPAVSDLFVGAVSNRSVISIDIPVSIDGKVAYDLAMIYPVDRLSAILQQQALPPNWYSSLLDSKHVIVATTLHRFVGHSVTGALSRALSTSSAGVVEEHLNLAGNRVFLTFCHSKVSGWSVVVGVPKATVLAELYLWILWAVAGSALISLFGIVMAVRYTRRISQSIHSLVDPALSLGCGGLVVAVGTQTIKETGEVASALVQASHLLQSRHAELLESEQRYRLLFGNASEGILIMSDAGVLIEVNESFAKLHGYSIGEMLGMSIAQLDTNQDPALYLERCRRIFAGETITFEVEHRHKDGHTFMLEVSTGQISIGNERYIQGQLRDITERKRSDQKIRRLTNLYAALSECSKDIVLCKSQEELFPQICRDLVRVGGMRLAWVGLVDPATRLVRVSAFCGEGSEHLEHLEISTDKDHPSGRGPTGTAIREGLPYWCQDFLNDPATAPWQEYGKSAGLQALASLPLYRDGVAIGALVVYTAELSPFDEAERSLLFEMSMNLSYALDNFVREAARKEAVSALQHSRAFLDGLIEQSPISMGVSDEKGTLIRANQALRDQFKVSDEELLGRYNFFEDPIVKEQGYMPLVRDVYEKGLTARFTLSYDTSRLELLGLANKAKAILAVTISPVLDAEGRVINAIVQHMDITELKQMEGDLKASKLAAEAANRAKSAFLANMSHEIRTPLHGIAGMAQLLAMTELSEEQQEYLETLEASSKNLLSLINDILDLSKIEAGKVTLDLADFSLFDCIRSVVVMQKPAIDHKRLSMELAMGDDLPGLLVGDQLRIRQILTNLIGNAVKFTTQGGITISTRLAERNDSSALVQIAVRDTGIGISAAAQDKVFDSFVQENDSTTRTFGGTGLGLSISRQLTELMGGEISVESVPGVGSCFTITLPLAVAGYSPAPASQ